MTTSGSIEHKVRQLDNDVHAIYEMLATISLTQKRHTNRFKEISEDLAGVKSTVATHDARFDGIDTRLEGIDTRLEGVDTRLEGVDTRLEGIEGKLDRVLEVLER